MASKIIAIAIEVLLLSLVVVAATAVVVVIVRVDQWIRKSAPWHIRSKQDHIYMFLVALSQSGHPNQLITSPSALGKRSRRHHSPMNPDGQERVRVAESRLWSRADAVASDRMEGRRMYV